MQIVLLVQSVSVFGIGRFGSILSSESWFRAAGCLSATGGSQLGSKLSVAVELMRPQLSPTPGTHHACFQKCGNRL